MVSFSLKVYYTLHKTHTASVWTDCFKKKYFMSTSKIKGKADGKKTTIKMIKTTDRIQRFFTLCMETIPGGNVVSSVLHLANLLTC